MIPYGKPYQILQHPNLSNLPSLTFLSLVLSRSCDFESRNIVRNYTYPTQHSLGFHTVFVIANPVPSCNDLIAEENRQYGDILQFSHIDSYNNISVSVLLSFHYVHNLSLPVKYIFKTDDDCVINYPLLTQIVNSVVNKDRLYLGDCLTDNIFNIMDYTLKNVVPASLIEKEYRVNYYARGGGYVISYKLLPDLLVAMRHLRFLTHHEDVNIGRGMELLKVNCIQGHTNWIARYGCESKEECEKYVVLHPEALRSEVEQFYSYF